MWNRALAGLTTLTLAATLASGCSVEEAPSEVEGPPDPVTAWSACQGSDEAFVEEALMAIKGRRPLGQAELNTYVSALRELRQTRTTQEARRALALAMMADDEYRQHWYENFIDILQVRRPDTAFQTFYAKVPVENCYGEATNRKDGGELAAWVRDHSPAETGAPNDFFDLGDVLTSTLELDDMSVIYRANVMHILREPLPGANVDPETLEYARRNDFGEYFEKNYINRDPTCLFCHNSDDSVSKPYHPIDGDFELSLYGSRDATSQSVLQYRSIFRLVGVGDVENAKRPWGWAEKRCESLEIPTSPDPYAVGAQFGSIGGENPGVPSVWLLEEALRRGFDGLRELPQPIDTRVAADDPDMSMAYLTSVTIVNRVWATMTGSELIIPIAFPRTPTQRETLEALVNIFIANGYSLKALVAEIAAHPAFVLSEPTDSCVDAILPALYNPYAGQDEVTDRIRALSGRELLVHTHRALEWTPLDTFPAEELEPRLASLGMALNRAQPGFFGLDFQARLLWEDTYGSCIPEDGAEDFVSRLAARAQEQGLPLEAAMVALKDRLLTQPFIGSERAALEELAGQPLSAPAGAEAEQQLRWACSAYLTSPQFTASGISFVAPAGTPPPVLTPADANDAASCERIRSELASVGETLTACP